MKKIEYLPVAMTILVVCTMIGLLSLLGNGITGFTIFTNTEIDQTFSQSETLDLNLNDLTQFKLQGRITRGFDGLITLDDKTVLDYRIPELDSSVQGSTQPVSITKTIISSDVVQLQSNADSNLMCTKWIVNDQQICHGSLDCCSLFGLSSSAEWDDPLTLNKERYNAKDRNVVTAQIMLADYSLDIDNAYSNIAHSDIKGVIVDLFDTLELSICGDACFVSSAQTLDIQINKGSIHVDNVSTVGLLNTAPTFSDVADITLEQGTSYTLDLSEYASDKEGHPITYSASDSGSLTIIISGSIATISAPADYEGSTTIFFTADDSQRVGSSNLITIDVVSQTLPTVKVGEPVKWRKTLPVTNGQAQLEEVPLNVTILDEGVSARDIVVSGEKKNLIQHAHKQHIAELDNQIAEKKRLGEEYQKLESERAALSRKTFRGSFAVSDAASYSEDETLLLIDQQVSEVEIEYYTPGPSATESEIDRGKEITISSDIHYQNIEASARVTEGANVRLVHLVNGTVVEVEYTSADTDENGVADTIEWVVPHLSNQTYQIIYITNAEELDSSREFIRDIYGYVSERDDNWTTINSGNYIRVTFETDLDSTRDITLYARSSSSNSSVTVYEVGGNESITSFVISSEGYYKQYLSNLVGDQDTFDLLVGGDTEFDYIVDPATNPQVNYESPTTTDGAAVEQSFYINVTIDDENLLGNASIIVGGNETILYDDSLLLLLNFDNRSPIGENRSLAIDSSHYGNNATFIDFEGYNNSQGRVGVNFSGSGEYIITDTDIDEHLANGFTLMTWVYLSDTSGSHGLISNYNGNAGVQSDRNGSSLRIVTGGIPEILLTMDGGSNYLGQRATTNTLAAGQWYHVAGTWNGTLAANAFRLFVNGVRSDDSDQVGGSIPVYGESDATFELGRMIFLSGPTNFLNGTMDQVQIWNRTFNESEILQHYYTTLAQVNETRWEIYSNQSNLTATFYNYSVRACDSAANCNETLQQTAFVSQDLTSCANLTLPGTYVLQNNLTEDGTCISILSDNVTIEGNWYTINYSNDAVDDYGIDNSGGYDYLTVRNVRFVKSKPSNNNHSIYQWGDFGVIEDNIFDILGTVSTSDSMGVYLTSANNNTISNNTFIMSSTHNMIGVRLLGADENTIINNSFSANSFGAFGLHCGNSHYNTIENNTFNISGTSSAGIRLHGSECTNNVITYNYFSSANQGVDSFNGRFNNITYNTFESLTDAAIKSSTSASNLAEYYIAHNTISVTGGVEGIYFDDAQNFTIFNNTINSSSTHIQLTADTSGWVVYANTFLGEGPWIENLNDSNAFNFSGIGNSYPNITSYDVFDHDLDGYGEIGGHYPLDNSTGRYPWIGFGADYHPITTLAGCGTYNVTNGIYTLSKDLSANVTCITIGAHNVTIDGSGYTINFSLNGTQGNGIYSDEYDNITIRDVIIYGYNETLTLTSIAISDAFNLHISNTNINTTGYQSNGIYLNNVDYVTIENNTLEAFAFDQRGVAIQASRANFANYTRNTITTNGEGYQNHGIWLQGFDSDGNLTRIEHNTIKTNGTNLNNGLEIADILSAFVANNTINTSHGGAISDSSSVGTQVINNTLRVYGDTGSIRAVFAGSTGFGNALISNNFMQTEGTASCQTILLGSAGHTNVTFNTINMFCSGSYAIQLSGQSNSSFINNTIDSSNTGIILLSSGSYPSNNNLFANNTITAPNNHFIITTPGTNGTRLIDQPIGEYNLPDFGSKLTYGDTRYGEIAFLENVNGSGSNLSALFTFDQNLAQVNVDSDGYFNKSANVTLYNDPAGSLSGAQIIHNDIEVCSDCTAFTSLTASTVRFNVTTWSNYSLGDLAPPSLSYQNPTPEDSSTTAQPFTVNTSIIEENGIDQLNWSLGSSPVTIFDEHLLLYLNFDNQSGLGENDSFVKDISSYNLDVTINGSAHMRDAGRFGQALNISEDYGFASLNNLEDVNITGNLTISAWIYTTDTGFQTIVSKHSTFPRHGFIFTLDGTNDVSFQVANGASTGGVTSLTPVAQNVWTHVLGTYNGSRGDVYINGVFDNVNGFTHLVASPNVSLMIGNSSSEPNVPFHGLIDEVRIYNRSFNQSEVYQLYAATLLKFNDSEYEFIANASNLSAQTDYTFSVSACDSFDNCAEVDRTVSVANTISSCQTLNQANTAYIITANLTSDATCLNITASNITVDGQGHILNYSLAGEVGYGILVNYSNDVTITDLIIDQGNHTNSSKHGILLNNSHNVTISFVNITLNSSNSPGIYLSYSNGTQVRYSTVNAFDSTSSALLSDWAENMTLFGNNFTSHFGGITLYPGRSSLVEQNHIYFYTNNGFVALSGTLDDTTIRNNTFTMGTINHVIRLRSSYRTIVEYNQFNAYTGMEMNFGSGDHIVRHNVFNSVNAIDVGYGTTTPANNISIYNNTIEASGYHIRLNNDAFNNSIYYNTFNGTGTWIQNYNTSNVFNDSITGHGNIYSTLDSFEVFDNNFDGIADTGLHYPLSNTTVPSRWVGHGIDYGPITSEFGCGVLGINGYHYNLSEHEYSNATCMIIGAHNIILDCQGYHLNYANQSHGVGVNSTNYDNITVQHCLINTEGPEADLNHGIHYYNSDGGTVQHNNVSTNGTNINMGIRPENSNNMMVRNNTVTTQGFHTSAGIYAVTTTNLSVENNTIWTRGIGSGHEGILLHASNYGYVRGNFINATGSSASGIELWHYATGIIVENNTAHTDDSSGYGVLVARGIQDTEIRNNVFAVAGNGLAIDRDSVDVTNITFSNNTLLSVGGSDFYIVDGYVNRTTLLNQYITSYDLTRGTVLLSVEDSVYGKIDFAEFVNGTGANLSEEITITQNFAHVNVSGNQELNLSANLTLYNTPAGITSDPQIVHNDVEICNDCYNFTSLTASTVIFNVSSWSNYSLSDIQSPSMVFVDPTPTNASFHRNLSVPINLSIVEKQLESFTYTWNDTNFTFFDESLVLSMSFENLSDIGENNSLFVDTSNHGHNASCFGSFCPTYNVSGRFGGAWAFDGENNALNLSNVTLANSSVTISAWVYINNQSTRQCFLCRRLDSGHSLSLRTNTQGKLNFEVGTTGSSVSVNGNDIVPVNTWTMVTATWNASGTATFQLFINNQRDHNSTAGSGVINYIPNETFYIGGFRPDSGDILYPLNGSIDELRVWNRSLTVSEVNQLYMSNLRKFSSNQWYFTANQSDNASTLLDSRYTYSATAADSLANSIGTGTFEVYTDTSTPSISYIEPTLGNESFTTSNSVYVNTSASDANDYYILNTFDDDLIMWHTFDEYENSTHFRDLSGRGHHANISGDLNVTSGYFGHAISPYATTSAAVENHLDFNLSTFTLGGWFYLYNSTNLYLITHLDGGVFSWGARTHGTSQLYIRLYNNSLGTYDLYTGSISIGEWTHFAYTYNGSNLTSYINGQAVGSLTTGGEDLLTADGEIVIGTNYVGIRAGYGLVDEVFVMNRSLEPEEVLALYNGSNRYEQNFESLSDGPHSVQTHIVDRAGNRQTNSFTVTVDSSSPIIEYRFPTPANNSHYPNGTFNVNLSIEEIYLGSVVHDWNGQNTTLFDESVILHLSFDNRSNLGENDSLFVDTSHYGNNATCTNCPAYNASGKHGMGLTFDGVDDEIQASNALINPAEDNLTFAVWFKANGIESAERNQIMGHADSDIFLALQEIGGIFTIGDGAGNNNIQTGISYGGISEGVWTHAILTVNVTSPSATRRLYINGVLVNQTEYFAGADRNNSIDVGSSSPAVYFNGSIDEVYVLNRTLNHSEASLMYMSSLRKYTDNQWYFTVNQSNNGSDLSDATYTFGTYVTDRSGAASYTDNNQVTIDSVDPTISYANPTLDNNSFTAFTEISVNVSTSDANHHYSFANVDDSLLLWMRMDELNDSAYPVDSSGRGHNATLIESARIQSGRFGNALWTSDQSGYAVINHHDDFDVQTFTLSAWVQTNSSGEGVILNKINGGVVTFALSKQVGRIRSTFYNSSNSAQDILGSNIDNGRWHHVASTYNGSRFVLYLDGQVDIDLNVSTDVSTSSSEIRVGRGVGWYFDGLIDELLIFNRSLGEAEIQSLYNASRYPYDANSTLSEGQSTFQAHTVDTSGRVVSEDEHTIYVDSTVPSITYANPTPLNNSYTHGPILNLTTSDNNDHYTFVDMDESVLLWMRFDDVNSSGAPVDISGKGNNGTVSSGAINSSGRFGSAISVDSGYVNVGTSPFFEAGTTEFSVALWVYADNASYDGSFQYLADTSSQDPSSNDGFYLGLDELSATNGIRFVPALQTDGWVQIEASNTVDGPGWYHVVATWNVSNGSIFVNGVDRTTVNRAGGGGSGVFTPRNANMFFGSSNDEAFQLNGKLDEILLFNRTLAPEEIAALYNASANQYQHNFSDLSEGLHSFQAHTVDQAGSLASTDERFITEDQTNPLVIYVDPTDQNASFSSNDDLYVNISTSDLSDVYSFVDIDDSLILWHGFEEYNNASELADSSGRGHNATLVSNATIESGHFGNAVGTSDNAGYVGIPAHDDFNVQVFTLSLWFSSTDDVGTNLLIYRPAGGSYTFAMEHTAAGGIFAHFRNSSVERQLLGAGSGLNDGSWHHLASTYNGSNFRLYIDGAFSTELNVSTDVQTSSEEILLGRATASYLTGLIDEVLIFNRSLSAAEVQSLYNSSQYALNENFTSLTDGIHTFRASSVDKTGKRTFADEYEVYIDTVNASIIYSAPTPLDDTYANNLVLNLTTIDSNDHYTLIDLDDILLLWHRFDDQNSSNDPQDISGNNFDGNLAGNAQITTKGRFGSALEVDGNADYLNIGEISNITNQTGTMSLWFNKQGAGSSTDEFLFSSTTSFNNRYYMVTDKNGDFACRFGNSGYFGNTPIYNNTWYHAVFSWKDGIAYCYLNTTLVGTSSRTLNNTFGEFNIGSFEGGAFPFNGSIDEVMLFNRTINETEIAALYNATANQYLHNFTSLSEGAYTFQAHVVDQAGHLTSLEVREITKDQSNPLLTYTHPTPDNRSIIGDSSFNVSATTTDSADTYTFTEFGDDLLLWITMDDRNTTHVFDQSSRNQDVQMNGTPSFIPGYYGDSLEMDIGNYLSINHHDDFEMNQFTISAWVLKRNITASTIIAKKRTAVSSWSLHFLNDIITAQVRNNTNANYAVYGSNVDYNRWYHVLTTFDGTNLSLYLDGTFNGSTLTGGEDLFDSSEPVFIGAGVASQTPLYGQIDDIIILNRSITSDEVLAFYNSTQNKYQHNFSSLADNTYTFRTHTIDRAGNRQSLEQRTVTTHTVAPTIAFTEPTLEDFERTNQAQIDVNVSTSDEYEHYSFIDLDQSLQLWLRFEDHNTTHVFDSSAYGNNGTIIDDLIVNSSGRYGAGAYFNSSGLINLSALNYFNFSQNWTFSAWVNTEPVATGAEWSIFSQYQSADNNRSFVLQAVPYDAGNYTHVRYRYITSANGSGLPATTQTDAIPNGMHHILITFSPQDSQRIYIDGQLESSIVPTTIYDSVKDVWIGSYDADLENYRYNGTLDEIMLFNRTLSVDEIQSLYNATATQLNTTYTPAEEGQHQFQAHTVDIAGNKNSTALRTITIDLAAPIARFINDTPDNASVVATSSVEFNFSIVENQLRNVSYEWNGSENLVYDDSLIIHLSFDNKSDLGENASYIVDSSIYGNNLSCTSCPDFNETSRHSSGFSYNGSQAFTSSHSLNIQNFTLTAWIYHSQPIPSGNDFQKYGIFNTDAGFNEGFELYVTIGNTVGSYRIASTIANSTGSNPIGFVDGSTATIENNKWEFVGVRYNGSHVTIIKNGEIVDDALYENVDIGIGDAQRLGITNSYFNGSIDELRLFNRSLSPDELQALYYSNLQKFNESQWYLYVNQSKNSTHDLHSGNYTYSVTVNDQAQNSITSEQRLIIVDADNPNIDYEAPTENNNTNLTQDNIVVNVSSSDIHYQNLTIFLHNSSGLINSTTTTQRLLTLNYTDLPNEYYWYNATAYDQLGNTNSTETRFITLDTTGPTIQIFFPNGSAYSYNESIDLNVSVNDTLVDISSCWYTLGANISVSCNVNTTFNVSGTGNYTINYYSNDTLNNINNESIAFVVDLEAPYNITFNDPTPANNSAGGHEVTLNWTVHDDMDPWLTCYAVVDGSEQNESEAQSAVNGNVSIYIPGGLHNLSVRCYDDAGNVNESETRAYTVGVINITTPAENLIVRPGEVIDINVSIQVGEDFINNMSIYVSNGTDTEILQTINESQTNYTVQYTVVNSTPRYLNLEAVAYNNDQGISINMTNTQIIRLARDPLSTTSPAIDLVCANMTYSVTNETLTLISTIDSDTLVSHVNITLYDPQNNTQILYTDSNVTDENGSSNYINYYNFTFSSVNEGAHIIQLDYEDIENQTIARNVTFVVSNYTRAINISGDVIQNITLIDTCTMLPIFMGENLDVQLPVTSYYDVNLTMTIPPQEMHLRQVNLTEGNISNLVNYTQLTDETTPPLGKRRVDLFDLETNLTFSNYSFFYNYTDIGHALVDELNLDFYQCVNTSDCTLVKQDVDINTDENIVTYNGTEMGRFMLTEPALSGDPDLFQPPIIIALNTSKRNVNINETINITLTFNISLILDRVILNVNGTTLSPISTSNSGKRYVYTYNYSPSQVSDYLVEAVVEDENTFNATSALVFSAKSPVSINLSAVGPRNISILDNLNKQRLFRNDTHTRAIVPGTYDLALEQDDSEIFLRNVTINDSLTEVAYYSENFTEVDAPTNRTSYKQFIFNSSLDFVQVELVINYSNISGIVEESNLELWKCPNATDCDLTLVPSAVDVTNNLLRSNVSNLSVFVLSEPLNTETVTETITETITQTSSAGGGGTRELFITQNKTVALEVIPTSPLTLKQNDNIEGSITVVNTGELSFGTIDVEISSDDLEVDLNEATINDLEVNETETIDLGIVSSDEPGTYVIDVTATSDDPDYEVTTQIIVNVLEKEVIKNQTVIVDKLQFAYDLFKENPECIEYQQIIDQAQESFEQGEYDKAASLIDAAVKACKDTITALNTPRSILASPSAPNILAMILGALLGIVLVWHVMNMWMSRPKKPLKKKSKVTKKLSTPKKKVVKKAAGKKKKSTKKDIWKK